MAAARTSQMGKTQVSLKVGPDVLFV